MLRFRRKSPPLIQDNADEALRREGLTPVVETGPQDIFVTGYPKSGNTWFQIMASILMYGADADLTPFTMMLEMVPDLSERKYYKRHSERMVFKSHMLPTAQHRRVVYLLRDGRDVMVSYKHYRQILDATTYEAEEFVAASLWPCHWHEHVEAWCQNPHDADMLFIRYEDLAADTVAQLRRFCRFAALNRSDDVLARTVRSTSFDLLKRKEAREGNWHPAFKSSDTFFRRGRVGSHQDELSSGALQRLLRHAGPTLEKHGYV